MARKAMNDRRIFGKFYGPMRDAKSTAVYMHKLAHYDINIGFLRLILTKHISIRMLRWYKKTTRHRIDSTSRK